MRPRLRPTARPLRPGTVLACAALVFLARPARADGSAPAQAVAPGSDPDPWFGRDKALHFGASLVLASGGYAAGTALFSERWKSFALGGGVAVAAGAAKEGLDAAGLGDPSWRDFAWDLIGTAAGLVLAYSLDWAVQGSAPRLGTTSAAVEALAASRGARASALGLHLSF